MLGHILPDGLEQWMAGSDPFEVVLVGGELLLFTLLVLGAEHLAFLCEACGLFRVALLNGDFGLLRAGRVRPVGIGHVSLCVDRLVDLVSEGGMREGRKEEPRRHDGRPSVGPHYSR